MDSARGPRMITAASTSVLTFAHGGSNSRLTPDPLCSASVLGAFGRQSPGADFTYGYRACVRTTGINPGKHMLDSPYLVRMWRVSHLSNLCIHVCMNGPAGPRKRLRGF